MSFTEFIQLEEIQQELKKEYQKNNIYLARYKTLYQIQYSQAQQKYYLQKIKDFTSNYTKRGYYVCIDSKSVNYWAGCEFVQG
jgi:hypothetical protein